MKRKETIQEYSWVKEGEKLKERERRTPRLPPMSLTEHKSVKKERKKERQKERKKERKKERRKKERKKERKKKERIKQTNKQTDQKIKRSRTLGRLASKRRR